LRTLAIVLALAAVTTTDADSTTRPTVIPARTGAPPVDPADHGARGSLSRKLVGDSSHGEALAPQNSPCVFHAPAHS